MLTLCGERRARNTLIRIRRLFNADLLVRRLAGAAAHAEEPEETGCETKGDGEPDDGEHLAAHGGFDVVGLEHGFEDAGEGGVDGGYGGGGGDDEDCLGLGGGLVWMCVVGCKGTYGGHNGGDEAAPAAEDGEEADDEFGGAEDQSDTEGPHHPPRHFLVCVKSLLHVVAKQLLRAGALELPYGDGVKPEVGLGGGAVGDGFLARLLVLVAGAVRPEADLVEILEVLGGGGALESLGELVVDGDAVGKVVEDIVGVGCKPACVCLCDM
jgi:hypothetical protein